MSHPSDHDLEVSVAAMLRFGVTLAALVVLAGGVLLFLHPLVPPPDYRHFVAGGPGLRTLDGIFRGALKLDASSVIQLGLLVLIATPVARVGFCVVGFARQRDKLYVAVSSFVLLILLYSLSKGAH